MYEDNNNHTTSNKMRKKRLPIFSISIVACYLVVATLFFAYGFGEGRSAREAPEELEIVATPTPTPTPEAEEEPEPERIPLPPPVEVKGVWVGAWHAIDEVRMANFIDLAETTEINALVLDIKEEHGYITMPVDNDSYPRNQNILMDNMEELLADMKSRGIYTIARVVCFKDPRWAARNPHLALRDAAGNQWTDRGGVGWLNPYERDNWYYIAELCIEAAKLGFEEIQLDYVRFPADGNLSAIHYGEAGELQTRAEVIAEFMEFIRDTMLDYGVRTTADVFGIIGLSNNDAQIIGQDLDLLLPVLHAISPMIYPSHFSNIRQNGVGQRINGVLFERPDKEPYLVIYHTLQHFIRRLDPDNPNQAILRPYLQDFTAAYLGQYEDEDLFLSYGPEEVRAQIQAVYDSGLREWILWSNVSRYSEEAFRNPEDFMFTPPATLEP